MKNLYTKSTNPKNSDAIMKDVMPSMTNVNKDVGVDLNQDLSSSGMKNIWTGTKSSLTYLKRHNQHHRLNFHKEFDSSAMKKLHDIIEDSYNILLETVYRRNVDGGPNGANRSAVPHGLMQKTIERKDPYKPTNGKVSTWIDEMPQRKKNAGLLHLQKKETLERNLALKQAEQQEK